MFDNVKYLYRLHLVLTMPCTVHEETDCEDFVSDYRKSVSLNVYIYLFWYYEYDNVRLSSFISFGVDVCLISYIFYMNVFSDVQREIWWFVYFVVRTTFLGDQAKLVYKIILNILKIYEIYFSKCIVSKLLLTMHLKVRSFVVDYAFETKIINGKQRFINLMVYISLIRTQGEKTPSAGLESWRNPTSPLGVRVA